MKDGCKAKIFSFWTAAVIFGGASAQAWAQSCAMCAKNASAAGPEGIQGLQSGILLLFIPTLLIFLGILWFTFRHSITREVEEPAAWDPGDPEETEPLPLASPYVSSRDHPRFFSR